MKIRCGPLAAPDFSYASGQSRLTSATPARIGVGQAWADGDVAATAPNRENGPPRTRLGGGEQG